MSDYLKYAVKNLFRNKFRTFLTIIGIAIGVCSVIIIGSISDMGKSAINSELNNLGIGALTIETDKRVTDMELSENDLQVIQSTEKVTKAVPIMLEYTNAYTRNLVLNSAIWGIDSGAKQIFSLELLYGRLIGKADVGASENVCVVDKVFAQQTYKRTNIVGKTIKIRLGGDDEEFKIIGVVNSGGNMLQSLLSSYIPTFVYVPYTSLQKAAGKESFDQIALQVADSSTIDAVAKNVIRRLEQATGYKEIYKTQNIAGQKDKLNNLLNIISYVLSAIAAISLIVAGLSIMTVMLVSVNERTREIGIKKAIGARRVTIMSEFILEAFAISILGSLIGSIIGLLLSLLGFFFMNITPIINIPLLLICIGFAIVNGTIFGVYPAAQASKLNPVDALRTE